MNHPFAKRPPRSATRPKNDMRPSTATTLRTLSAALLFSLVPATAMAQPDDPDDPPVVDPEPEQPESERLAEEAREALADGAVSKACTLFAKSVKLDANEDVQFELAQCLERDGNPKEAAKVYEAVAADGGARSNEAQRRAKAIRDSLAKPEPEPTQEPEPGLQPLPMPKEEPKPTAVESFHFSDFIDTRLTFSVGDDDVVHATGETVPLSPNVSFGDRRRYRLFFDNLNSVFAGRENLTHLVLYSKMPGFIDNLDTEASLVLRFDMGNLASGSGNLNSSLYDSGSFIRLFYHFDDDRKKDDFGLGLTMFPIDTDRVRLGWLYDISWGGTNARINQSIFPRIQGSSPGFKLQFTHPYFYLYGAMKTAQIVQVEEILTPGTSEVEVIRVGETNYGGLFGAGAKITEYANLDIGGGYFQQGKFDLPDVLGEDVFTFGVSARASVHDANSGTSQSIDFSLYRNDPMAQDQLLAPTKDQEDDDFGWTLSAEFTNLWQNLKDFDVTGQTKLQQARAAALQLVLRPGDFSASLTGIYRDLPYVLRNVPSFVPFETLPGNDQAEVGDELFVAANVGYFFDGPRLTPSIGAGLQFPSTFKTTSVDALDNSIGRTVVIRQQGDVSILPVDRDSVPIFQTRASLKWDISKILSSVLWVQFIRDNNGTFVERDPNEGTVALRSFVSPNFLGFGGAAQARF